MAQAKINSEMIVPGVTALQQFGLTLDTLLMMLSTFAVNTAQKKNRSYKRRCYSQGKIHPSLLNKQQRNNLKSPPRPYSKTGFKGVIVQGSDYYVRVWTIEPPYKKYVGGVFKDAGEAAKYYDKYMRENIGDWVYLNFR
jgi:hypothetical protein